ncbi:hypothetical protein CRM22_002503 [Opisthorchis felineus]|uniref:Uncharacterized protein n=1 Tax=Opisthorchis felineus TaxID=147828 RepID=A0A4S2MA76_OPIFE|nr:hypothetical protein CRM22_002503 [Opisthorchis felineus]
MISQHIAPCSLESVHHVRLGDSHYFPINVCFKLKHFEHLLSTFDPHTQTEVFSPACVILTLCNVAHNLPLPVGSPGPNLVRRDWKRLSECSENRNPVPRIRWPFLHSCKYK